MKQLFAILLALAAFGQAAQAQWYTKTYNLAAGWNGIWLSGDASYTTVGELFGGTLASGSLAVSEVWRWNPNPDQTQFIQNPSTPTTTSDEWTVWKRDGSESKLTRMVGNSSYLIRTNGPTSVSIKMKAITPSTTWLLSGANFLGFPALSGGGVMSTFFSSMISGGNKGLPTGTKVYKYVGGELSATNPIQVSVASERVDPDTAYWFNYGTVSDFEGPLEYELPSGNGLAFGRTLPTQLLGITNRSSSAVTLTFALVQSDTNPPGQPAFLGAVPLVQRTFSPVTNSPTETPVGALGSFTVSVPASGRVTLEFGVNRAGFTEGGVYASILRVTDSLNLSDVRLPVTAQAASPAGLWVCEVKVNTVSSTPAVAPVTISAGSGTTSGGTGTTSVVAVPASQNLSQATQQAFPLYYLLHIDGAGVTRVLRQAFVGKLTSAGNALGITVKESLIQGAAVSDVKPARYFSPILPYATPVVTASGTAPGALQWTLTHGYDDPANPFVHTYHPDHDNLDAKFSTKLPAGRESYTVVRTCALSFTAAPPDGSTVAGWGSMIFGGLYTESLSGLNKFPLQTGGTFRMRRLSEISDINTTTP
jgi:hypothetical protein